MEMLTVHEVIAILKLSQSLVYGLVASGKTIRRASSVIDYIFRRLGMQFTETYRQEKLLLFPDGTSSHNFRPNATKDDNPELSPIGTNRGGDPWE